MYVNLFVCEFICVPVYRMDSEDDADKVLNDFRACHDKKRMLVLVYATSRK